MDIFITMHPENEQGNVGWDLPLWGWFSSYLGGFSQTVLRQGEFLKESFLLPFQYAVPARALMEA